MASGAIFVSVYRGGRGAVVAGRAEVALAERERVAEAPRLHQTHQGVVDRRVAVRVELPHHVADDARALRERAVGAVAAVVHRVDHPAVHRLQAVAHLRQRTSDDDAHRVVEVGALHLELQVDLLDAVAWNGYAGFGFVCHVSRSRGVPVVEEGRLGRASKPRQR